MLKAQVELAAALKQAKTRPMFFALVAKGANDGALIVNKAKVPAKAVTEAKARSGGGAIYRGRCLVEDGVLVYEVPKEPPATLAQLLRTLAKRDGGFTMPVTVRVGAGLEEEGDGTASEEPTPSPDQVPHMGGDGRAEWGARLTALTPRLKQALQDNGPLTADIKKAFAQANTVAGQGDWQLALAALTKVEDLVGKALQNGSPDPEDASPGLTAWQTARAEAVTQLRALKQALAETGVEGADRATILLESIVKNLSPRPATLPDVVELETYIQDDDVITRAEAINPFGIVIAIRDNLLQALAQLKQELLS